MSTGPGKFALASNVNLVQSFFDAPFSITSPLFSQFQVEDSNRAEITKVELAAFFGLGSYGLSVDQKDWDDGSGDFAERAYIWGNTSFQINDEATFVIEKNESGFELSIDNFSLEPRRVDGNYRPENFNFESDDISTELTQAVSRKAIDPSGIGRTVELLFSGDVEKGTYTREDYESDQGKNEEYYSKFETDIDRIDLLQEGVQSIFDNLYEGGITSTLFEGKTVVYGTEFDDRMYYSITTEGNNVLDKTASVAGIWSFDLSHHKDATNGLALVGGHGDDRIVGFKYDDYLFGGGDNDTLYGRDGEDVLDGGKGQDELTGGQGNDRLLGGDNSDVLRGDDDEVADLLDGGEGADKIYAGLNDIVIGGDANDTLYYKGSAIGETKLAFDFRQFSEYLPPFASRDGYGHYFLGSFTGTKENPELLLINTGTVLFGIDATGKGFAVRDFESGDYGLDVRSPSEILPQAQAEFEEYGLRLDESRFIIEPYVKLLSTLNKFVPAVSSDESDALASFSIGLSGHAMAIVNTIFNGFFGLPYDFRGLSSSSLRSASLASTEVAYASEIQGNTDAEYLEGTDQNDLLEGLGGSDILVGKDGSDTYVWKPGDGDDAILEQASGSEDSDTLRLNGISPEQLVLKRTADDLTLTFVDPETAREQSIFVPNQFVADGSGIERIEFDNGVVWDGSKIATEAGESSNFAPFYLGEREFEIENDTEGQFDPLAFSEDYEGDELSITDVFAFDGEVSISADGKVIYVPPSGYTGQDSIFVTISDGNSSSTVELTINVVEPNNEVVVSSPIADQTSDEDNAWSFVVPEDTFSDADGDTLTLSARLEDGSSLPSWLSFDADTRTFSGTPPQDFNGTLSVEVVASDGESEASDVFVLEISPVNDAPVVSDSLDDQSGKEDTAVNFVLPEDAFTDVDGDTLTLSATQADGSDLPGWLSFDAQTRAFSGTPPLNFNGSLDITVTASDGALSASDTFTLEFEAVNDAPIVSVPLEDKSSDEDAVVSFTLPSDAFTDVDEDTLTFTATMADGSTLPAWLAFDAGTRTFSGTPPQDFNGVLNVSVVASDGTLSASDTFELEITPVNDAPILAEALEDQSGTEDTAVSFVLPEDAFSDVDGDTLSLSARLEDGSDLPDWLSFDADSRTFSGTPPQNYNGTIDITVTASDGVLEASDTFSLDIAAVNDAPTAIGEGGFVVASGTPTTFAASGLLANDVDVDGDALTITSVSSTSGNATVELDANGNVVYTAANGFDGEDSFTYTISDGELTATAEVMLVVEADDPYEGWEQGTDGRDWMFGDLWSSNQIYGAGGNDIIVGGFYGDQLAGGTGNDRIWGNWGNDELHGNDGRDRLFGGFGNDTLSGGAGNDRLWGGWGRDNFVYEAGDGRDKIMDFETGHHWGWFRSRGDTISIDVDGIDSFTDLMGTASQDGRNVVFDFGNGDELILSGTRLAALDKDAFTFY
ncbi:outer membrane adhesin like protein [Roseibium sp. TrichSKD4]|uniref:putative Ig domain-containing protein n=1 Tax=Roseibium sp. TrichSKD4 TaxID=744980 RepID=UPI0001E5712C|nr:putative Ig domain-containing protein [Roseibium sp. TrichSKD4]EFO28694.1 outer membrane adhesin like protein [Roseibium sp. TrichSKD4]